MTREYYWSLSLEPGHAQAAIWYVEDDIAHVMVIGPSVSWEEESQLVNAADTTISSCIQQLPKGVGEPTNTVFGVPPSWVNDGQINKDYLGPIRDVCAKLSLTPTGFVVYPEAIANYLKIKKDGATNIIVIGLGQDELDVSVFRLGSLNGTITVPRTVSLEDDVATALNRFGTKDPLPSRFVIYDGTPAICEEAVETLKNASWADKKPLTFLHSPSFYAFSPNEKLMATSLAGATEIASVSGVIFDGEETIGEEEDVLGKEKYSSTGFKLKPEPQEFNEKEEPDGSDDDVEFFEGEDIESEELKSHANVVPPSRDHLMRNRRINTGPKVSFSMPTVRMPKVSMPSLAFSGITGQRRSVLIVILVMFILVVGFVLWWFLPSSEITLFIKPQKISSRTKLSVSTVAAASVSEGKLLGREVKTSVSGNERVNTTGNRTTGDKAKGSVTIRNGTAVSIKLPQGSVLTTSNNLRYTLDSSASVSAAVSPLQPGEATIPATADVIGSDSNISKGELFKVANYPKSEVDAVASSDFTGGSSRQIKAVSKDDLKNLEDMLTLKLNESAKSQLSESFNDSDYLLPQSEKITVTNKKFDKQQGEEAETLSLELAIDASSLVVSKDDVISHAKEVMSSQVSKGYVLRETHIQFSFPEKPTVSGDTYQFDVDYKANLLPNISIDDIKEKITGKYPKVAQEYFSRAVAGFSNAEIILRPALPGMLGTLPHRPDRIEITLSSE